MDSATFSVAGLNVNAVTKALKQTRGVKGVDTDLAEDRVIVTYDETQLDPSVLARVIDATRHR